MFSFFGERLKSWVFMHVASRCHLPVSPHCCWHLDDLQPFCWLGRTWSSLLQTLARLLALLVFSIPCQILCGVKYLMLHSARRQMTSSVMKNLSLLSFAITIVSGIPNLFPFHYPYPFTVCGSVDRERLVKLACARNPDLAMCDQLRARSARDSAKGTVESESGLHKKLG